MATKINFKEMSYIYRVVLMILFLQFSCGCAGAKEDEISVTDPMPLDKSIRYGRLPNGFTYYIKSLPEPQDNLFLRFYNKVGSNQEEADWLQVAHGVEHLAFRSSRHFPNGLDNDSLVKQYGVYFNASSGARSTTYEFDIPAGSKGGLDIGLKWFKDIASGLKLTDPDIEQVKGELRQEALERAGDLTSVKLAKSELDRRIYPCRHDDSHFIKYFENANPSTFRTFYKDWYRPDLLSISVVGNIENVDGLEQKIIKTFSTLRSPKNSRKPSDCDSIYYSREPSFVKVERAQDSSYFSSDNLINLNLYFPDRVTSNSLENQNGLQRLILLSLLNETASDRLDQLAMAYNSFDVGMINTHGGKEFPMNLVIKASLETTPVEASLREILTVLRQLAVYGAGESEFIKLKHKYLEYMNSQKEDEANYWVKEIGNYITTGEALPADKTTFRKNYLSNLTLNEFNNFLHEFLSEKPKNVGLIAPTGNSALKIKENDIRGWISKVYNDSVPPYQAPVVPDHLMGQNELAKLDKVKVLKREEDAIGAIHVQLSNGVKLIYKQIDPYPGMYEDDILINGFTLKGASCFAKDDLFSAVSAPSIISNSGVGKMDKFEVWRFLETIGISPRSGVVTSYIDKQESGIQAVSSVKNLEAILQLIYLKLTKPNKNPQAFKDWKSARLKASKDLIQRDFRISTRSVMQNCSLVPLNMLGHKDLLVGTRYYENLDKISLDKSFDIYKKIFGNAKDFTFVISGKVKPDEVLPVLEKYLGNLPNSPSPCQNDLPKLTPVLPKAPVLQILPTIGNYNLPNIKYDLNYLKEAKRPDNWKEQLKIEALGHVTTQIAWRLRYKMNYSLYSVSIGGSYNFETNRYQVSGTFECVPDEFPLIRKEMHKITTELKSGKLTEEEFKAGMDWMYGFYGPHGFGGEHFILHKNLYKHYRYGQAWVTPKQLDSFVKSLSVKDIVQTARKMFQEENKYEYVMGDKDLDIRNLQ